MSLDNLKYINIKMPNRKIKIVGAKFIAIDVRIITGMVKIHRSNSGFLKFILWAVNILVLKIH